LDRSLARVLQALSKLTACASLRYVNETQKNEEEEEEKKKKKKEAEENDPSVVDWILTKLHLPFIFNFCLQAWCRDVAWIVVEQRRHSRTKNQHIRFHAAGEHGFRE
jgi:hypothetical protein